MTALGLFARNSPFSCDGNDLFYVSVLTYCVTLGKDLHLSLSLSLKRQ